MLASSEASAPIGSDAACPHPSGKASSANEVPIRGSLSGQEIESPIHRDSLIDLDLQTSSDKGSSLETVSGSLQSRQSQQACSRHLNSRLRRGWTTPNDRILQFGYIRYLFFYC